MFRIFSPCAMVCNVISRLQDKFNQYLSGVCSSRMRLIRRHQALFARVINRGLWWATCVDDTPRFLAKTWAATQWTSRDFYILFASTRIRESGVLYRAPCYSAVFEFLKTVLHFPSLVFLIFEPCRPCRSFVLLSEATVYRETSFANMLKIK